MYKYQLLLPALRHGDQLLDNEANMTPSSTQKRYHQNYICIDYAHTTGTRDDFSEKPLKTSDFKSN